MEHDCPGTNGGGGGLRQEQRERSEASRDLVAAQVEVAGAGRSSRRRARSSSDERGREFGHAVQSNQTGLHVVFSTFRHCELHVSCVTSSSLLF
jgi:hypothetical protein